MSNKKNPNTQASIERKFHKRVGPFITRVHYSLSDGSMHTWASRAHRKGSGNSVDNQPANDVLVKWLVIRLHRLSWWLAVLFMIGSACFAAPCINAIWPGALGPYLDELSIINAVFFIGSIFFTLAAYLQLLEAVNAERRAEIEAGKVPDEPVRWFAWRPAEIGWCSAFIQFVGTLFFNINTFDAMLADLDWLQQDLLIWTPDIIGCICFLVASWLAVIEQCHRWWAWQPTEVSWWCVMINMLGSIAFMIAGIAAFVVPSTHELLDLFEVNLMTLVGAICFFVGAYLLLPEMALWQRPRHTVKRSNVI